MTEKRFTIQPALWSAIGLDFWEPDLDGDMAVHVVGRDSEERVTLTAEKRRELILFLIDHTPIDPHNRHYGAASCGRDDAHGPHRVRLESTDQWHECMGTEPQHKSNYGAPDQHMTPDHNTWQCRHTDCVAEQEKYSPHNDDSGATDDEQVEADDDREARRTGGTFAAKHLGPTDV